MVSPTEFETRKIITPLLTLNFPELCGSFSSAVYEILMDIKNKEKSSGILGDKTMINKYIYIPNDDKRNYLFCRFELLVEFERFEPASLNQLIKIS